MSQNFQLLAESNQPTVIGKAWWNEALKLSVTGDGRRTLIGVAAAIGALALVPPVCGFVMASGSDDDGTHRRERRDALASQKEFGWSFGAADQVPAMVVPGPPLTGEMNSLAENLAPKNPRWRPAYVPTLFQSLSATPTSTKVTEDAAGIGLRPLRDVIHPMYPQGAIALHTQGDRIQRALKNGSGVAVVVDLWGPDSVVFAAALAERFDPVFLFDNWPHPRGVVPAHLTLASALANASELGRHKGTRIPDAPSVFVLDRYRLAPYTDDANEFDNRSLARLPTAEMLKAGGIAHVYYVAPPGSVPTDKDDVVDDLVAWQAAGIEVRAIDTADYASLDDATTAATFARDYGLPLPPPIEGTPALRSPAPASLWRPQPRASAFSAATPVATPTHTRPTGFASVPVVVHVGTGMLLGAALYRNGSWNRVPTSSTYYGGG
ncbi:MAG: hypothetical protein Q8O67_11705 [Deltaproteobacteria bacterium]|nr:hypothetical protein [Deltaproteobacteria bacterium]